MNSLIQLIIKIIQRLLNPNQQKTSGQTVNKPKVEPQAPPKPKPVVETPVAPEPVVETPAEPVVSGPISPSQGLQFNENFEGEKLKSISITDGKVAGKFRRFSSSKSSWKGWYTVGQRPIKDFIRAEGDLLQELKMTESSQNLLQAVSENEGKLEAINGYDGAFLSFGIFQWTLGTKDNKGELPALMKKLKNTYPDTFQQYFGRYGVDISDQTDGLAGYLTLNGTLINTRALKEQFRSKEWVYRFWRAGGDRKVQAVEVEHALSRLKTFYWRYKVHGHTLNKIITSEYGVALLLDNHVNIPALVKRALKAAMDETGLTDPTNWNTEQERKVLEAYIKHRATKIDGFGPMYDAINRAKRTANYLTENIISDKRGSLRVSDTGSRGLFGANHVPEPDGFNQEEYPEVDYDLQGRDMGFLFGEIEPDE